MTYNSLGVGKLTISNSLWSLTNVIPPNINGEILSAWYDLLQIYSPSKANFTSSFFEKGLPKSSLIANTLPVALAALLPIPLPGFIFFIISISNP